MDPSVSTQILSDSYQFLQYDFNNYKYLKTHWVILSVIFSLEVTKNHSLGVVLSYSLRHHLFLSMTTVILITAVIKIYAVTIVTKVTARAKINAML